MNGCGPYRPHLHGAGPQLRATSPVAARIGMPCCARINAAAVCGTGAPSVCRPRRGDRLHPPADLAGAAVAKWRQSAGQFRRPETKVLDCGFNPVPCRSEFTDDREKPDRERRALGMPDSKDRHF